jgi:hypothetical protein
MGNKLDHRLPALQPNGLRLKPRKVFLIAVLLVPGCSPVAEDFAYSSGERAALSFESMPPPPQGGSVAPRLIKTGSARIEVEDLDEALALARRLAIEVQGFIAGSELNEGREGSRSASLALRLPSDSFDPFLEGLPALGRVLSVSSSASDVSREYLDVETRLSVKEETVRRLRELAAREGDLEDLLAAERELGRALSELESLKAQRQYYDQKIAESDLRLTLIEPGAVIASGAFRPVVVAFRDAARVFAQSIAFLIYLVVSIVPWALIALAVWPVVKRVRRLRSERKASQST